MQFAFAYFFWYEQLVPKFITFSHDSIEFRLIEGGARLGLNMNDYWVRLYLDGMHCASVTTILLAAVP
jgi:hypothetical protein